MPFPVRIISIIHQSQITLLLTALALWYGSQADTQIDFGSERTIKIIRKTMIRDCCILENKANRIFYQASSYTITLSYCTVDSTSNNGYLTIQNTVTKSFILALNHISTQNCHSGYDMVGTLTPISQSPSSSKKKNHLCTCENFFIKLRLSDFISLISVLISNFINPYASSYPLY